MGGFPVFSPCVCVPVCSFFVSPPRGHLTLCDIHTVTQDQLDGLHISHPILFTPSFDSLVIWAALRNACDMVVVKPAPSPAHAL